MFVLLLASEKNYYWGKIMVPGVLKISTSLENRSYETRSTKFFKKILDPAVLINTETGLFTKWFT